MFVCFYEINYWAYFKLNNRCYWLAETEREANV